MTLIVDEKGRKRHEKYKLVPEQIVCSICGVITAYSKAPLKAIRKDERRIKTLKNRKTGGVIHTQEILRTKKTGEYICKNCA